MADIFLSYSRSDLEHARRIERALESRGWTVFWDRELLPGEGFRRAIAHELDTARCVIVLWSRASVESEWVIDEAETGKQRSHLVSVVIDDVQPPLGFRQGQFANLVSWLAGVDDQEFERLVRGVHSLVPPPAAAAARGVLPSPAQEPKPSEPAHERRPATWHAWFASWHHAVAPTLLLAVVFAINYLETRLDQLFTPAGLGVEGGYPIADAFRWFEWGVSFDAHDAVSSGWSMGYSLSYFFVFPLLCLFVAYLLARRPDPLPYRVVTRAVAIDYFASLPFFLFFPVPERWSFPDSEAMLLSDKASERLIEAIRPISGLDNSFPSFHVSLTTVVVTACFVFGVPFRTCVLALGATVILSTFALGIHWIPDILAGGALGVASLLLAWRSTSPSGGRQFSRDTAWSHAPRAAGRISARGSSAAAQSTSTFRRRRP